MSDRYGVTGVVREAQARRAAEAAEEQRRAPFATLRPDNLEDYLAAPRERYLPFLPAGGLVLVHGPGGCGKSLWALELAAALAGGRRFLKWQPSRAVGVMLIQGEVEADELAGRMGAVLAAGAPAAGLEAVAGTALVGAAGGEADVGRREVQDRIVAALQRQPELRVLILDSLSSLWPGTAEERRGPWQREVVPFLRRLRRHGVAVVLVHHSNRAGRPRGTAAREDAMDAVIQLQPVRDPLAAGPRPHLRVSLTKWRFALGGYPEPIEARLEVGAQGELSWSWAPAAQSGPQRLAALVRAWGTLTVREAAAELGEAKSTVQDWKRKLTRAGVLRDAPALALVPDKPAPAAPAAPAGGADPGRPAAVPAAERVEPARPRPDQERAPPPPPRRPNGAHPPPVAA